MKSTLLTAAGQLNLNLESRAKQGHRKKSVQLYSRGNVWPSLFLQRDILVDVSTGWRPLTSPARGAKQPLPEPQFFSPIIIKDGLNMLQMLPPKAPPASLDATQRTATGTGLEDSDEQGGNSSSSSSTSDSGESSDEETSFPPSSSIMVMNTKSHVVHAVRPTKSDSAGKCSFLDKGKTWEVLCGSPVLGSTIQVIVEIPQGARVCQRKACLASIDYFLK